MTTTKTLTEEQRDFLQKYILGKSKRQKAKTEKEFLDFERRKGKVVTQIEKLPIDTLRRKQLQLELDNAQKLAVSGEFKRAYDALKATKKKAKLAANGFIDKISAESIREKITQLDKIATHVASSVDDLAGRGQAIIDSLAEPTHPKIASFGSVKEQFEAARAFVSVETDLLSLFAGLNTERSQFIKSLSMMNFGEVVRDIAHEIKVFADQDAQAASDLTKALATTGKKVLREGKYIQPNWLAATFQQQEAALESKIDQWKATDRAAALSEGGVLDREAEILKQAKERYKAAQQLDVTGLSETEEERRTVKPLPTFDLDSFMEGVTEDKITKDLDEQTVSKIAQKAKGNLLDYMKTLDPNSDILFDLTLKSPDSLARELALANGVKDRTPPKVFQTIAKEMYEAILSQSPNEMAGDGTEVTVGGKKYTNQKFLGAGAYGNVYRYEDDSDPPNYIVVKTLKDPSKRGAMVSELANHRHAMGGEEGQGHPNMIGMKGVAVNKTDGSLHMILENADGGDLRKISQSISQLSASGVISKEAHDAIMTNFLRQAAEGLKYIQDRNMTHHDIKDENYLVGSDGTIKIADFGSGAIADEEGEVSQYAVTTRVLQAPEIMGDKKVTGKADTYTLGVMISMLNSHTRGYDRLSKKDFKSEQTVTALDRLQNAMLDPDPSKRPSLDAVLFSSYMMDARESIDPKKIERLVTAGLEYSKKVGKEVSVLQDSIFDKRKAIVESKDKIESLLPNGDPQEIARQRGFIADWEQEIVEIQKKVDAIHNRDDVKPLMESLREANEALRTRSEGGVEDAFAKRLHALRETIGNNQTKFWDPQLNALDKLEPRDYLLSLRRIDDAIKRYDGQLRTLEKDLATVPPSSSNLDGYAADMKELKLLLTTYSERVFSSLGDVVLRLEQMAKQDVERWLSTSQSLVETVNKALESSQPVAAQDSKQLIELHDEIHEGLEQLKVNLAYFQSQGISAPSEVPNEGTVRDRLTMLKQLFDQSLPAPKGKPVARKEDKISVPTVTGKIDCKLIYAAYKNQWKELKKAYKSDKFGEKYGGGTLSDEDVMWQLWAFRKQEVDGQMRELERLYALPGEHKGWEAVGSTNLESDYDITIFQHGQEAGQVVYDWQLVQHFNNYFMREYKTQPGILFDTNLYASAPPAKKLTDNPTTPSQKAMKKMAQSSQDVGALMKQRRYMSWEEYDAYMDEVLTTMAKQGADDDALAITRLQFEEADDLFQLSLREMLTKARDLLANTKEKTEAQNKVLSEIEDDLKAVENASRVTAQKLLIEAVHRLEKHEDVLLWVNNELYTSAIGEVRDLEQAADQLANELTDSKYAGEELIKKQAELDGLVTRIKKVYTDAVFFANEAYHTEGPFKHIVEATQAVGSHVEVAATSGNIANITDPEVREEAKVLTEKIKDWVSKGDVKVNDQGMIQWDDVKEPPKKDLQSLVNQLANKERTKRRGDLSIHQCLQSFNEQLGDFLKDLEHYADEPYPGTGFYRSSKYLERLIDAVELLSDKAKEKKVALTTTIPGAKMELAELKKKLNSGILAMRKGKLDFESLEGGKVLSGDALELEMQAFAIAETKAMFGVVSLQELGQCFKKFGITINAELRSEVAKEMKATKEEESSFFVGAK